ncbi:prephenate dehydratase [Synechococcales cyanobacterium C]|uniref:Prephenate dehydratase n=1 Tax=Petrachloros mirabilis ULC683 TaxID=2781853 RepID=A0A8K2A6L2_9CYAN|nr:prephenate dehydratase [Petrachloros mirabilis]NCJ05991.1 prephenate dehydratase [Petrachloros mirabilis ULC683]
MPLSLSIAHLGPAGTYAEQAAFTYRHWFTQHCPETQLTLVPCPSIALTLRSTATGESDLTVVPVENSLEGSVSMTLDTLWQLENLQIRQALVLPIVHVLVSEASRLQDLQTVYSHPQALGQCQRWLEQFVPQATLVPANATTEALKLVPGTPTVAAIASQRAATLYNLPILAAAIQDHPDNCTRFWVVSQAGFDGIPESSQPHPVYTSLAFSLPANAPGALVKPLQIFAERHINLSRIESRPSKRSLGDYVFFVDAEAQRDNIELQSALAQLTDYTEVLKVLGSYPLLDHLFPLSSDRSFLLES